MIMGDNRIAIRHQNDLKPIRKSHLVFEFFSKIKCSKEKEPKLLYRLGSLRFPTFVRCHRIRLGILRKVPLAVDLDEITPGEKPPKMTHYIGPVVADRFCILKDAANGRRCLHTQNLFKQIECA
jgi:hypothetical protein